MNKTEDDELDAQELTEDELRQLAGIIYNNVLCSVKHLETFMRFTLFTNYFTWVKITCICRIVFLPYAKLANLMLISSNFLAWLPNKNVWKRLYMWLAQGFPQEIEKASWYLAVRFQRGAQFARGVQFARCAQFARGAQLVERTVWGVCSPLKF